MYARISRPQSHRHLHSSDQHRLTPAKDRAVSLPNRRPERSNPLPLYSAELDIAGGAYQFHLGRENGRVVLAIPDRQRMEADSDHVDRLPPEKDGVALVESVLLEFFLGHVVSV